MKKVIKGGVEGTIRVSSSPFLFLCWDLVIYNTIKNSFFFFFFFFFFFVVDYFFVSLFHFFIVVSKQCCWYLVFFLGFRWTLENINCERKINDFFKKIKNQKSASTWMNFLRVNESFIRKWKKKKKKKKKRKKKRKKNEMKKETIRWTRNLWRENRILSFGYKKKKRKKGFCDLASLQVFQNKIQRKERERKKTNNSKFGIEERKIFWVVIVFIEET